MLLMCANRCGGALFRALFAEVDLDSGGEYQHHRILQPSYICLNCGSPALDLSEVPGELRAQQEEDEPPPAVEIPSPVCESPARLRGDPRGPNCRALPEEVQGEG